MLYTKIQPQTLFLCSGEEDFRVSLPYMSMAAILFNGTEPFKQNVNILLTEGPMWNLVKISQAVSEKKTLKITQFYTCNFIHVYSPGARADSPQGIKFYTFWVNDFSTFSPYKCIGAMYGGGGGGWGGGGGANLTLPQKGQRSTYDHHLKQFGRPWVRNAIYHDSASKLSWFWRRF